MVYGDGWLRLIYEVSEEGNNWCLLVGYPWCHTQIDHQHASS